MTTRNEILSDVAGKVWKIEAKIGDTLEAEGVILILESMKMEIPVEAEDGGKLVEILVAEGDPIDEGQPVAVVEA